MFLILISIITNIYVYEPTIINIIHFQEHFALLKNIYLLSNCLFIYIYIIYIIYISPTDTVISAINIVRTQTKFTVEI